MKKAKAKFFGSAEEAILACQSGINQLKGAKSRFRLGESGEQRFDRNLRWPIIFNEVLPEGMRFVNESWIRKLCRKSSRFATAISALTAQPSFSMILSASVSTMSPNPEFPGAWMTSSSSEIKKGFTEKADEEVLAKHSNNTSKDC
jgi:hypothetical protein